MQLKIQIKTIDGMAEKTLKNLMPIIGLGRGKTKFEGYVNKEDNMIYLDVAGDSRHVKRIEQNINKFSKTKREITHSSLGKYAIKKLGGTEEQILQLQDLFDNDTEINIIRNETAQELLDEQTTVWDRIKTTFRRIIK